MVVSSELGQLAPGIYFKGLKHEISELCFFMNSYPIGPREKK